LRDAPRARSLAEQASLLRFGLLRGLVDAGEVAAWADAEIARQDNPPASLLEVATSTRRGAAALASELGPLAEGCGEATLLPDILALIRRELARTPRKAQALADLMYDLACSGMLAAETASYGQMWQFADGLLLARDGVHGSEAEVMEEMRQFLACRAAALPEYLTDPEPPRHAPLQCLASS
jgi:hypothetical protein